MPFQNLFSIFADAMVKDYLISDASALIRPRVLDSHKGTYGHGLLLAGSNGMAGASVMAARAALRSGIGLLTVAAPDCNRLILQTSVPEAMMRPCGMVALGNVSSLDFSCYDAVAIGPGIGMSPQTADALRLVIERTAALSIPLILDADALNLLAKNASLFESLPSGTILTPHPGEFARLAPDLKELDRVQQATSFVGQHPVTLVLKGYGTLVATPDGRLTRNTTGNPGMATGGSGDVLTGILLALRAQGVAAGDAARLATFVHGLAGDKAAARVGHTALVATDIIASLPEAWKTLANNNV